MALITKRVSDLSGEAAAETEFVTVTVRQYPGMEKPVKIDALKSEVGGLKSADNLVVLELQNGGDATQLVVTKTEFDKLAKDMKNVLGNARGVRGREPRRTA